MSSLYNYRKSCIEDIDRLFWLLFNNFSLAVKMNNKYKNLQKEYLAVVGATCKDNLTGLFNYGFFQMIFEYEFLLKTKNSNSLSLAAMDIDSFSEYNKSVGRLKGDYAIKKIASIIKTNIDQNDYAARYSGNEFKILLTDNDYRKNYVKIEKIMSHVEKSFNGNLTISSGFSVFPDDAASIENLITNSNTALLQSKINGKNRIYKYNHISNLFDKNNKRILVVDDDRLNVKILQTFLMASKYDVIESYCAEDALTILKRIDIDLIILDIRMGEISGLDLCEQIKVDDSFRMIPVIILTAFDDIENKIRAIEAGADDFITKPPNQHELLTRIRSLIKVKDLNTSLANIENVLFSLANAVEEKDPYTQGHIRRVAEMAVALAKKMNLSSTEIEAIRYGGILHDVGKIGIPVEILNKPGKLSPTEWEIMKKHSIGGYKICLPLKKSLKGALDVIRYHHEKLDGSGYPDGLKGNEIPLSARVMAVVDIYDALTTTRPYRLALSKEVALKTIQKESDLGKLDKNVVKELIELLKDWHEIDHF